jgi:hypothetical protein
VRDADQSVHLKIDLAEAAIVRRLFEMYASGLSLKRIAWQLNSEGVQSPQPQKGRVSRSWCVSSVRHILRNRRYAGKIVWNTRRKLRVPGTGKRVFRPQPESEWVTVDAPHLRIITPEAFAAVERRFEVTKKLWGIGTKGARAVSKNTFTCSPGCFSAASVAAASPLSPAGPKHPARSTVALSTRRTAIPFAIMTS